MTYYSYLERREYFKKEAKNDMRIKAMMDTKQKYFKQITIVKWVLSEEY